MPTETKKIDEKRSRKGAMSATIWWLYSLSETIEAGEERAQREREAERAR